MKSRLSVIVDKITGDGFIEMAAGDKAQSAIAALNGSDLDGRTLTVGVEFFA